jgi:hypothetical protein
MKSITRSVFIVVVVVMALSATAAASASAAEWYVGGSALTGSAALASATKTVSEVRINTRFGGVISCGGVELKGADIAAKTGGQIEHLLLTKCWGNNECDLESETIETKPLSVEAALGAKSPEDKLVLKPVSGTLIAEYKVTNPGEPGCGGASKKNQISGKATLILPKGREELAEQELLANITEFNSELKWDGGSAISMEGAVNLKLASGKAWSFH